MARMRVVPSGLIANFSIKRRDGHELSLSSSNNSLVHFSANNDVVQDFGGTYGVKEFMQIVADFIKDDE